MKIIKVGLVGFGKVAEVFHLPLIKAEPQLVLTHVVERHRNRSQEIDLTLIVVRSLEELLQTDVDLVVILTPNQLHFPQAKSALLAGKHVVVDKPFTVTSAEARELAGLAEEQDLLLSVFQNRRWDGDFLTVKELLQEKTLGKLVEFESRFDRFRPQTKGGWREEAKPGSGILYDLCSHLADQAVQLFGLPRKIWADIRVQREGAQIDDFFEVVADYPELRVTLKATCLAAEKRVRFLLRGTEGAYLKHGLDSQEDRLKAEGAIVREDWGKEPEGQWGSLYVDNDARPSPTINGDYPAFYADIVGALEEGREPLVTANQAADVILFLELAEKSSKEGRWISWS